MLTIIVEPTFWETPWALLLLVTIAVLIVGAIIGFLLYIHRMKRRQQETLTAYLALLEQNERQRDEDATTQQAAAEGGLLPTAPTDQAPVSTTSPDDPFMQRVLSFVEANLSNSDADISQMADACAVSRSVLQRKMKQLMGVTPLDFLREARLKHAAQLLKLPGAHVADVAYKCGFSDPKYFGRCFKKSTGMSPSDYKAKQP